MTLTRRQWAQLAVLSLLWGLLAANELQSLAGRPIGVLWLQAAALSWALGTVLMRRSALPAQASAFSVMAVPLVGIAAATAIVGEVPQISDWLAALCIAVAIVSATGRRVRSDNPAP